MKTLEELKAVLQDITYKDWTFRIGKMGDGFFLQVQFTSNSNDETEGLELKRGRKWHLSPYMSKSEVVQTAFLAVMTAEEHETRQGFKYREQPIFCPIYSSDALADFAAQSISEVKENYSVITPNDLDF